MDDRFIRNPLTKQEQEQLRKARVFVAGCGGLGGYVLEHLTRIGVGFITCADDGRFETSNINRQILALSETIGHEKALCAKDRIQSIWNEIEIQTINLRLNETNLPELIRGFDLVIDALDNVNSRRALFKSCKKEKIPVVYGAVKEWWAQVALVMPDSELYDMIYPKDVSKSHIDRHNDSLLNGNLHDEPVKVLSPTVGIAASMQSALAVSYLLGIPVDNKLFMCDLKIMEFSDISL